MRNTTAIEDNAKISSRTFSAKAPMDLAQEEIQSLKHKTYKTKNEVKESLKFTQDKQSDLVERMTLCKTEKSSKWDELTH